MEIGSVGSVAYSKMMFYLLFTFIAVTSALKNNDGPCPTVYPVNNFNYTRYTNGKWYELARYDNAWEGRSDCVDIDYQQLLCGITFKITLNGNDRPEYLDGNCPNSRNRRDGYVNHIADIFLDVDGLAELRVSVLDTDYDNYSILYSCQYDELRNTRTEYSWVQSRFPLKTDIVAKALDFFLRVNVAIDPSKLIWSGYWRGTCN